MKVYAVEFNGYYPVGACAVVIAESEEHARAMMAEKFKEMFKDPQEDRIYNITKISKNRASVNIILDGDY